MSIQAIFLTLESSAFVDWFLISMWGFPVFIALHSVGMAIVVGLSLVIALRYLGVGQAIDQTTMIRLASLAWIGFMLNVVTGLALLVSRISEYLIDPTFLIKIALVLCAASALRVLHYDLQGIHKFSSINRRLLAVTTMLLWFGAITAGRWIAYLSEIYG